MSNATSHPPVRAEDPDAQFINFSEDFRRSKRNSLSWSAIAVFIAFAPSWGEDMRAGGFSIPYSQGGMTVLVFSAACFFLASYARALSRIVALNSKASQDQDRVWGSIEAMLAGWLERLKDEGNAINRLHGGAQKLLTLREDAEKHLDDIRTIVPDQKLTVLDSAYGDLQLGRYKSFGGAELPIEKRLEAVTREYASYRSIVDKFVDSISDLVSKKFEDFARIERDNREGEALLPEQINGLIGQISALTNELNTFRDSIVKSEQAWHLYLDRVVVYGLFWLSTLGATAKIFSFPLISMGLTSPFSGSCSG